MTLNFSHDFFRAFGDACLTSFVDLFDFNVTITKIIWRLDSRKSFAINKLIVRNNTIKKWVNEGKSVQSILPPLCNVSDLSLLMDDGRTQRDRLPVEIWGLRNTYTALIPGPTASTDRPR